MSLNLGQDLKIGISTIHREPDNQVGPWQPKLDELCRFVEQVDRASFDSLWVGDHLSYPIPFFDPLLMLAQAAVVSRRLHFGTGVYLLPLRHVGPVAKQVATLDHLTEGRFTFGIGVGGEFPKEYEVCGVPLSERGPRMSEQIRALRALWQGNKASFAGKFYAFSDVDMQPPPRQPGGPPIWCGGRSPAALKRTGELADGYYSYAITAKMFAEALEIIEEAAVTSGRRLARFGSGHLLFCRIDTSYQRALDVAAASLTKRYGMDFRPATERYAALGEPQRVAEGIRAYYEAGVRHIVLDLVGPYERREEQVERVAAEVLPLLRDLRDN